MSYCINPACPEPQNPDNIHQCKTCGSSLLLRDRYHLMQPLGQGGFGATFLAQDIILPGRPICVVKQLRPTTSSPRVYEMAKELFEREANALGKLGDHPQVPRLLDFFEAEHQFYLVQEYVRGSTLKQEVKFEGPFHEEKVKECLRDLMPLLEYIHSEGVIHRDIKPANIIRRMQDNHLVLIDFGAVKDQISQTLFLDNPDDNSGANTKFAVGTFSFAPPEQMSLHPVYASDIYAVGMTCLFLMTGKSPKDLDYDPNTGSILWQSHVNVSKTFARILSRMLEPKVGRRYQSASDVLKALNNEDTYFDDEDLAGGMVTSGKRPPTNPNVPTIFNPNEKTTFSSMSKNPPSGPTGISRPGTTGMAKSGGGSQSRSYRPQTGDDTFLQTGNTRITKPAKWTPETVRTAYVRGQRDFGDCELSGLNLPKFNLSGCNFYEARLTRSNLQGADLTDANFGHASLMQANLRDANLTKAYMSLTNLEGADLRGANLKGAYLTRANLRGTNLCGANLTDATVSNEQLAMAKTNLLTVRPDGKRGFGF
jgi:serine/threonine protein kinase, bacterial